MGPMGGARWWVWVGIMLLFNYLVFSRVVPDHPQRLDVPYTFFRQQVEAGAVVEVTI